MRAYHLLAPLLALKRPPAMLIKPLSQMLVCLQAVPAAGCSSSAGSAAGQHQQQQAATRVAAAVAYHLLQLASREGEQQVVQQVAKLDVPLLQAALGSCSTSSELQALQDALLMLPAALAPAALASKSSDDLVAAVLPMLAASDPLAVCWPLLTAPSARSHPRWVELSVRAVEAAVRKQATANVQQVVAATMEFVKQGLQMPRLPHTAKWKLAEAAAALQLPDSQLPQQPDITSLSSDEAQQAQQAWKEQCRDITAKVSIWQHAGEAGDMPGTLIAYS